MLHFRTNGGQRPGAEEEQPASGPPPAPGLPGLQVGPTVKLRGGETGAAWGLFVCGSAARLGSAVRRVVETHQVHGLGVSEPWGRVESGDRRGVYVA